MLMKMVNMNNNQQQQQQQDQRESNTAFYQTPPLPLKLSASRSSDYNRQRAPLSAYPEADSQSGPYKAVPAPKPLAASFNGGPPPPYRQPPPANSSSPVLAPVRPHLHHQQGGNSDSASSDPKKNNNTSPASGHALLAHSSKFPIEREVVVTTSDKVAEVGRIERQQQESSGSADRSRNNPLETDSTEKMQAMVTQSAWNEERRTQAAAQQQQQQGRHGAEVIAGAPHHSGHLHYPADVFDHATASEEMHRPASYMPMHIHYTGWRQENNYVPMNFDGRHHSSGASDPSLSFDSSHYLQHLTHNTSTSSGPSSLLMRDPLFAPAPSSNSMMTHYEIHVDSAADSRPRGESTVTVAPWNSQQVGGDTSTFDRLRDTCNKMFLRDGNLRGSSQFAAALSPTLPRAMERMTMDQRVTTVESSSNPPMTEDNEESSAAQENREGDALPNNKSGSMRKKLAGKTYHHIKDMFTTKFNKTSKSKVGSSRAESSSQPSNTNIATTPLGSEAIIPNGQSAIDQPRTPVLGRQPDPIHSINQRIHSQIAGQQQQQQQEQVWGSYGRQTAKMESSNDVDASALAKLTLSPTLHPHSPYNLRHGTKPSVTFRMDLNNECQYSGGDNSSSATETAVRYVTGRPAQGGQVVLYDDTMHFPQNKETTGNVKTTYGGEHDSSLSSIASATGGHANNKAPNRPLYNSYADYDVPPNKSAMMNSNEGGSSSGHQSAGSSSDLDKRSGQSVSTNDSGVGVVIKETSSVPQQRNRPSGQYQKQRINSEQNSFHLDTSTETEMFVGRAGHHQTSSDWADAADREVNNVMELRSYQQQHQQQWLTGESANQQAGLQSSTPPLPPLSPEASPKPTPKMPQKKFGGNSASKPDLLEPANHASPMAQRLKSTSSKSCNVAQQQQQSHRNSGIEGNNPTSSKSSKRRSDDKSANKSLSSSKLRGASKSTGALHPLTALQEALDLGEITSTTTGLDLEGDSDSSSSHSDDDLSTTMDMNESRNIRRQLEGLESMYSEVLKALHKKSTGRSGPVDHKLSKRRMYGSVSSLPSSICSRPIYRDRRTRHDDRRRPKESKTTNKRFQRLESHVVTLARSVAHLSSEMRTQHIMIQEMETIRSEIAQLRAAPFRTGNSSGGGMRLPRGHRVDRDTCWKGAVNALTDPSRVKKLTSFFGDEPPLLRIFLKKLGYEKYSPLFEQEKIGMIELPYLTEERLHKMGIPMGPRIRILQEAQLSLRSENISDYGMV